MLIDKCLLCSLVPALILAATMPLLEESSVPRDCTRTVPVVIIGESSRSKHYKIHQDSTNPDDS